MGACQGRSNVRGAFQLNKNGFFFVPWGFNTLLLKKIWQCFVNIKILYYIKIIYNKNQNKICQGNHEG